MEADRKIQKNLTYYFARSQNNLTQTKNFLELLIYAILQS